MIDPASVDKNQSKYVTVDLYDPFSSYREVVESLEEICIHYDEAIADIIAVISRKDIALNSISQRVMSTISTEVAMLDEVTKYMTAWENLSKQMLYRFLQLGLYRNNYLYYQIQSLLSTTLIMEKIEIPDLNNEFTRNLHISRILADPPCPRNHY